MGKICSSEEGQFLRADKTFCYLQHSFFSGLLRKKFHGRNGAKKAKSPLHSGAVPTIQSVAATSSAAKVLRILFTAQDGSANRTCLQENPSTEEEVDDGQCIEISYIKSTEK